MLQPAFDYDDEHRLAEHEQDIKQRFVELERFDTSQALLESNHDLPIQ